MTEAPELEAGDGVSELRGCLEALGLAECLPEELLGVLREIVLPDAS